MCIINSTDTKDYTEQENFKCPETLQLVFGRNLIEVFPNLTTDLNCYTAFK